MAYESLIKQMTLEEKCALLSGAEPFKTRGMKKYGIPQMQFSDGPHGLRLQGEGANHLGIGGSLPAITFAPQITVSGSMSEEDVNKLVELLYQKFAEFMDRYNRERRRTSYA